MKKKLFEILQTFPELLETYRKAKHNLKKRGYFNPFLKYSPPGNYNNPLLSYQEILDNKKYILQKEFNSLPSLDLKVQKQLDLLKRLSKHRNNSPYPSQPKEGRRYYSDNNYFSTADASALSGMLREFKPSKVIEIGSGFSSAIMLDTNELFLDRALDFFFIEPFTQRLKKLLNERDRAQCSIIEEFVQNVDLNVFDSLDKNDILFVDSSHVLKVGSDLSFIFFSILPRLKPGVIVHFHDIFWPFEYPLKWYFQGRAYNEAYVLRTFLQYNEAFEILFFPSYLYHFHNKDIEKNLPMCLDDNGGGSIYIRKRK